MADLNLTRSQFHADRFVAVLQRANLDQLDQMLDKKRMSALERDTLRKAHAMLHGNIDEVEVWFETVPELLERDGLTERERNFLMLTDLVAETCCRTA